MTSAVAFEGYRETSPRLVTTLGWSFTLGVFGVLVALVSLDPPHGNVAGAVIALGAIGIWRWSWSFLHLVRSAIYRHLVFPRIRARAEAAAKPTHLYVLVTSYRMSAELNALVYRRIFEEVRAFGVGATIVSAMTDPADAETLQAMLRRTGPLPEGTSLILTPQRGRGKRDAMARALTLIARARPDPESFVVLMDGDSILGEGTLARTAMVLAAEPSVGAVTGENVPWVKGTTVTREWYRLRMAQRDNQMCSMSLSRRLLVLTGRFSIFRATLALDPEFILGLEDDTVRNWRLGDIRMVTGDDKSTWFVTLKRGWEMLYVPDAVIHPVEELPAGGFFRATTALMVRWYGNMIRNTGRAIMLGPRQCGLFPWICLVDQRISMWTTLVGPTSAATLAFIYGGGALWAYLLWVMMSRSIACVAIFAVTGRSHPFFPFVLYYSQLIGSVLKIYVSFHPYRQRWTRQAIGGADDASVALKDLTSGLLNVVFVVLFMLVVVLVVVS